MKRDQRIGPNGEPILINRREHVRKEIMNI